MRKLLVLSVAAALACGASFKDQARDAMPSKSAIQMGSPQSAQSASRAPAASGAIVQAGPVPASTLGDHAPFFDLTVGVSSTFNGGTAIMLGIIEAVTTYEPTSCTHNSCTWGGPGSGGALDYNDYKLVVSQAQVGDSFNWELSGQPKNSSSGFIVFMSGTAKPGPQKHHGSGSFDVDFDKAALLPGPHDATGQLHVTSYSNVGPAKLEVNYVGAKDSQHPGQKNDVLYSYANDLTGGGDLDFAVHNTTSGDRFSVHSRWKNDGRGRADVAGTGTWGSVSLSECWGAAPFSVVYFNSTLTINLPPWGSATPQGSESACAFSPAAFSPKTAQ